MSPAEVSTNSVGPPVQQGTVLVAGSINMDIVSALARGKSLDEGLKLADLAASICVQRRGAAPSIPRLAEFE